MVAYSSLYIVLFVIVFIKDIHAQDDNNNGDLNDNNNVLDNIDNNLNDMNINSSDVSFGKKEISSVIETVIIIMLSANSLFILYCCIMERQKRKKESSYHAVSSDEFHFDTVDVNGKLADIKTNDDNVDIQDISLVNNNKLNNNNIIKQFNNIKKQIKNNKIIDLDINSSDIENDKKNSDNDNIV